MCLLSRPRSCPTKRQYSTASRRTGRTHAAQALGALLPLQAQPNARVALLLAVAEQEDLVVVAVEIVRGGRVEGEVLGRRGGVGGRGEAERGQEKYGSAARGTHGGHWRCLSE